VAREIEHHVLASSFADPADVRRFRKCKDQGKSDEECFKLGDNGVGFFGDDCTGTIPMCALPPEDMIERWETIAAARHREVEVWANGRNVICILADRMPHRANIKNGAGIDLSPAACEALRLSPPIMTPVVWRWIS
jgi:hypothetical protein